MKPLRALNIAVPRAASGFLLIEVMVAVFLSALLVVSLAACMQRAVDRAEALANDFEGLRDSDGVSSSEDIGKVWSWGPRVETVLWRPGPELDIWVGGGVSSETRIGIWADGWLLGEWEAAVTEEPTTVSMSWWSLEGSQLCVRAREVSGLWGPPWRCVVPDAYGNVVVMSASDPDGYGSQEPAQASSDCSIVVHTASFSTPPIEPSWAEPDSVWSADGLVFLLPDSEPQACEVNVGGERQSWYMTEGRQLDVYF